MQTAQLAGQNAAASAVAAGRRVAGWEDGRLVEIETAEDFFKRGHQLAKAADRGEPLPKMKLLDVVVTKQAFPEDGVAKGHVGTIVEELDNNTVLVEFSDLNGVAYAITAMPVTALSIAENGKPTLAQALMAMPDVGRDADFARIEEGNVALDPAAQAELEAARELRRNNPAKATDLAALETDAAKAATQMRDFMLMQASAPKIDVDIKKLIDEGRK